MLGRGDDFQVTWIISLQATYESCPDAPRQVRILAIGLGGAPPSRVTRHVNRRTPEGEEIAELAVLQTPVFQFIPSAASLIADGCCHALDEFGIPCGTEGNGLGEDGETSRTNDAVQSLITMKVLGYAQTRNTVGRSLHQIGLLLERQSSEEVHDALAPWQRLILEGIRLCPHCKRHKAEQEKEKTSHRYWCL